MRHPAIDAGGGLANSIGADVFAETKDLPPGDAVLWWCGFLGALMGACCASIGPAAAVVVMEKLMALVEQNQQMLGDPASPATH